MKKAKLVAILLLLTGCNRNVDRISCIEDGRVFYQSGRKRCYYIDAATGLKKDTTMNKCDC